jgi:hypothetical protein
MPINQRNAGFISATYQPLQVANAPTIGAATAGDTSASVAFTAPANVGGSAISAYYAVSNPDRVTVSGASSPINVTGLTNGTAYTFSVWALNTYGPSPFSGASGSVTPAAATRGVFAGGSSTTNVIDYVTINSAGNAIDFGDLTVARYQLSGCSSATRGVFAGGEAATVLNVIDYITIATIGNALDFGDLSIPTNTMGACSNSTRGVFAGGEQLSGSRSNTNRIEYITIVSTGNSTDFGDLTVARAANSGCSSTTRGLFQLGASGSNIIEYITIATTGNALDFGDLTVARYYVAACSSNTRGVFGGGTDASELNIIDYVTIASTGNATDFGDLTVAGYGLAATSDKIFGVFGGGVNRTNTIDRITIASTGNATSFGNLTVARSYLAACSDSHGGL